MTESNNTLGSILDFQQEKYTDKKFVFILVNQNVASSYSDSKTKIPTKAFPGFVNLKLESEVFHSGRRRIIRHIKGEQSIFKDEQSPDDKIPKALTILQWVDGIRIVEGDDVQLLQYLMMCDQNSSKPGRDTKVNPWYQLLDMGSALEKEIQKDMKLTELKQWCYSGPWDEVAAYARVNNVSLAQDPNQVRFKMKQLAEKDPIRFMAGIKSPAALRKHYVLGAIDAGFITKDINMNALLWDNGTLLINSPMGIDPVDYFVDHAETPNGGALYQYLLEKLGKAEPTPVIHGEVPVISSGNTVQKEHIPISAENDNVHRTITHNGLTMAEVQKLLKQAEDAKVINRYGRSAYGFDLGGPNERKFVGSQKVLAALKEETEFLAHVKEKLGIK